MRAFLVLILLMQGFVVQAGVPGIACSPPSGHPSTTAISTSMVAGERSHAAPNHEDSFSSPHERVCCAFTGHCAATVIATDLPNDALPSPAAYWASRAIITVATGFDHLPYRPPSSGA